MTMASSGTAALGIADDRSLAITPDGTRVVYVGSNNQLFVRPLDRLDATAIYNGRRASELGLRRPTANGSGSRRPACSKGGHHRWAGCDDRADQPEDRGDLGAG